VLGHEHGDDAWGNVTSESMSKQAIQLGKALNDPIKGITALAAGRRPFDDAQKETIKHLVETGHTMEAQKIILRELHKEFGGSAEAAGKTFPGQLNILKETFLNVGADLLKVFIPAISQVAKWLSDALPHMESFARGLIDRIKPAVESVVASVRSHWPQIQAAFHSVIGFVQQSVFPVLLKVGQAFIGMGTTAVGTLRRIGPVIEQAFHGLLVVAKTLADFLGSDFGKKIAIAGLALYGISHAVHTAQGALRSLTSFKFNPWVAGAAIAIGALSTLLIKQKGHVNEDAAAFLRLRDSAHRLRDGIFDLKQAQIDVTRDTRGAKEADDAAAAAKRRYTNAVQEHGQHSRQAQAQLRNYKDAALSAKQADLDLLQSQARLGEATRRSGKEFAGAGADLRKMVTSAQETQRHLRATGGAFDFTGDKARQAKGEYGGFLRATEELAVKFGHLATKLQDVNPKASANARTIARQAQAAHDLALNMGDIPDFEKVVAQAQIHFSVQSSGKQSGGFIPMLPGAQRGKDDPRLTYMLAPGEVVLNEEQQEVLGGARRLAQIFGFEMPPGMADGGYVGSRRSTNTTLKAGFLRMGLDQSNWPVPPALIGIKNTANEIDSHHYHYAVGGGNSGTGPSVGAASWSGGPSVLGYDCSGAINTVLHMGGGFATGGFVSGNYLSWGESGSGSHMTIYAKPGSGGDGHVYSDIDNVGFGTSGENPGGGAGWFSGGWRPGYSRRHPPGLARGGFSGGARRTPLGMEKKRKFDKILRLLGVDTLYEFADQGIMPGLARGGFARRRPPRRGGQRVIGQRPERNVGFPTHETPAIAWGQVPDDLAEREYDASLTPGTADDLAVLREEEAFFVRQLAFANTSREAGSAGRLAVKQALQGVRDRIKDLAGDGPDAGIDPVSGLSWGVLPDALQEEIFDARQTDSTADDALALTHGLSFLNAELARATTPGQRLAVKQAIASLHGELDPQKTDTAEGAVAGLTSAEVNAQITAGMAQRQRFYSEFSSNIFSAGPGGLTSGATPLASQAGTGGQITQNLYFPMAPPDPYSFSKKAQFMAEAAR
jgi:hypothetical protein